MICRRSLGPGVPPGGPSEHPPERLCQLEEEHGLWERAAGSPKDVPRRGLADDLVQGCRALKAPRARWADPQSLLRPSGLGGRRCCQLHKLFIFFPKSTFSCVL